jgi:hypothetical protein
MDDIKDMLFNIQRFQILALYTSGADRNVSDSYAYAWAEGVYPLFNESAPWHNGYEDNFKISASDIRDIHELLCDKWEAKTLVTFYDLEAELGISGASRPGPQWDRIKLMRACRYLYLQRYFDDEFWAKMLEPGRHPGEASGITRQLTANDIYFE